MEDPSDLIYSVTKDFGDETEMQLKLHFYLGKRGCFFSFQRSLFFKSHWLGGGGREGVRNSTQLGPVVKRILLHAPMPRFINTHTHSSLHSKKIYTFDEGGLNLVPGRRLWHENRGQHYHGSCSHYEISLSNAAIATTLSRPTISEPCSVWRDQPSPYFC